MQTLLSAVYNFFSLQTLCDVGNITVYKDDIGSSVSGLNSILTTIGSGIGGVCIAIAVVKLIMSIAEENSKARMDATIMFGVGIFFLSMTTVIDFLLPTETNEDGVTSIAIPNTIALLKRILALIGSTLSWAGGILACLSILLFITSIAQENAEAHSKAAMQMGVAIGLLSFQYITDTIITAISAFSYSNANTNVMAPGKTPLTAAEFAVSVAVSFIGNVCTYIGGGITLMAIFKLIYSIREENSKDRESAFKFLMVGVAFLGIMGIFKLIGIKIAE